MTRFRRAGGLWRLDTRTAPIASKSATLARLLPLRRRPLAGHDFQNLRYEENRWGRSWKMGISQPFCHLPRLTPIRTQEGTIDPTTFLALLPARFVRDAVSSGTSRRVLGSGLYYVLSPEPRCPGSSNFAACVLYIIDLTPRFLSGVRSILCTKPPSPQIFERNGPQILRTTYYRSDPSTDPNLTPG